MVNIFYLIFIGLFVRSNDLYNESTTMSPIQTCTEILENVQFYRTDKADCWIVDEALVIEQTFDGFVRYVHTYF